MTDFKLDTTPKINSGFLIPEKYFENFQEHINLKLLKKEPKVISIFKNYKKRIVLIAASVIIALLMIPIYNQTSTNNVNLDDATLENYITNQSSINQYDLISQLDLETIENMNIPVAIEDKNIEDLLLINNNLEQYIIE